MSLQQQWAVNGTHYSRTLEAWLQKQDRQRKEVLPIMEVRLSRAAGFESVFQNHTSVSVIPCAELQRIADPDRATP